MRCPSCGTANAPEAVRCAECGVKLGRRRGRRLPEVTDDPERPLPATAEKAAEPLPAEPRNRPPARRRKKGEADHGDRLTTLIPFRNTVALAAYYCGVFALVPLVGGLVLGPAAFVLGILGLRRVQADPRIKGTGHAVAGVVLGALTFVGNLLWVVLMALGVVPVPTFR